MTRSNTSTVEIGMARVTFTTHHLPDVGPRVSVRIEEPNAPVAVYNWSPIQLRELCTHMKIAACEAEAIARRDQRGKEKAA